MRDPRLFAIPLLVVLGGLMVLHAYWASGGQWGIAYTVPIIRGRRSFDPSPFAKWVVCGLLGLAAMVVMGRAGWIGPDSLPPFVFDVGIWGLSLVFLGRTVGDLRTFGFFKTIKNTPFARWDSWVYTPLCFLIALLAAALGRLPR
jgi:hypothetical protein